MFGRFLSTGRTVTTGESAEVAIDSKARIIISPGSGSLEYETVAAGQTAQVLGATGATGDFLSHVILQPAAVGAGTTTILDNATVIFTYTSGTLGDLRPIVIPINAVSVSGAWKITTGANMAAVAFGDFT